MKIKRQIIPSRQGCGATSSITHCCYERTMALENNSQLLTKLYIYPPYEPPILLPAIRPRGKGIYVCTKTYTLKPVAALFIIETGNK